MAQFKHGDKVWELLPNLGKAYPNVVIKALPKQWFREQAYLVGDVEQPSIVKESNLVIRLSKKG